MGFFEFFKQTIDLRQGTDVKGTIESIDNNIAIKGSNVWILAAAAVIASIGLDVDSQAVIIGAMLISPLMSPILGVGLSVGINDRDMLRHSMENLAVAVGAALVMSTLYFLISPFGDENPQIMSRTRPTLLDVGIAFFGGVAGIVAGSRTEKTNAIPGVAIATALMPPLCVAGYGLAKFKWDIFFGASYLFFLNAAFIALSTYMIVRFLRFPYREFVDKAARQRTARWMGLFVILIILPSCWLFFTVLRDQRNKSNMNDFVERYISDKEHFVMSSTYVPGEPDTLRVVVSSSRKIDSTRTATICDSLARFNLEGRYLDLQQFGTDDVQIAAQRSLRSDLDTRENLTQALSIKTQVLRDQQQQIDSIKSELDSSKAYATAPSRIDKELALLYPQLEKLTIGATEADSNGVSTVIALVSWQKGKLSSRSRSTYQDRIAQWLKQRLDADSVLVSAQ
ncbi:MAG: DUF389 domain-containing protein [Bacteroidia bacterium]